jgi:hypothetical protein
MEQKSPTAAYEKILGEKPVSPQPKEVHKDAHPEDDKSTSEPTWKPELKRLVELTDEHGEHEVVALENFKPLDSMLAQGQGQKEKESEPGNRLYSDSAILLRAHVRRSPARGGAVLSSVGWQLEIQSENLRRLFKTHAWRHKELNLDASPIIVEYPFTCLFFLRDKLRQLSQDDTTPLETRDELRPLLRFMEEPLGSQRHIEEYDDLVLKQHQINFPLLWSIFPPYSPVVMGDPADKLVMTSGYLLESITLERSWNSLHPFWNLSLLHGHHDGAEFSICRTTRRIPFFSGNKDISLHDLPVIPLHLIEERERQKVWDTLVERGKKYVRYCEADTSFLHYKGRVTLQRSDADARLGAWDSAGILEIDERVVLDRTAQRNVADITDEEGEKVASSITEHISSTTAQDDSPAPEAGPADGIDSITIEELEAMAKLGTSQSLGGTRKHLWRRETVKADDVASAEPSTPALTEDDYFICQSHTIAFALDQKAWVCGVRISQLEEITWDGDPFKSLQLSDETKNLVERLVRGFNNRKEDVYDDIIPGKGKGLIFLLHGPPGLGKTLTAESVAESAHRPLYRVTTGELSTDVKALEEQLTNIFRLGARWRAVVLLDEADVLMAKRTVQDLHRNTIVAVFLRLLEYYRGMLFLTTNRRDDFDEAFHSRIHVTLQYGSLTPTWRTNIWREHVERASQLNKVPNLWTPEIFAALGQIQTNGRDIKNFTRTAYAFARAEDEDLTLQHVLVVLKNNLAKRERRKHKSVFEKLEALEAKLKADVASREIS